MRNLVALLAGISMFSTPAGAAITSVWTGGPGSYTDPSKWSPFGVPDNHWGGPFSAVITNNGSVVLNTGPVINIEKLEVDVSSSLKLNVGTLQVNGGQVTNNGVIAISTGGSLFCFGTNTVLSGGGLIKGEGGMLVTDSGKRITNLAGHRIYGEITVGWGNTLLTNDGVIEATPGQTLLVDIAGPEFGTNFNSGVMRANGGVLSLESEYQYSIDNSEGLIEAQLGSTVRVRSVTISGGAMKTFGDGIIKVVADDFHPAVPFSARFFDMIMTATVGCSDSTVTHVGGAIQCNGSIKMLAGQSVTDLVLVAPVTFSGTGEIHTSASSLNRVYSYGGGDELTLAQGFTLHGAGLIGMDTIVLNNAGVIDADATPGMTVDLYDAAINVNSGTIRATGATLTLTDAQIENAGGTIEARDSGTLHLDNVFVQHGTVSDGGGTGTLVNDGTSTLESVTLDGALHVAPGSTLRLYYGLSVEGSLVLDPSALPSEIRLETAVSLEGGGTLVGSDQASHKVTGVETDCRLINGPNNTIRGSLNLGADQAGLTNHGLVLVDSIFGMTIDPGLGQDFTNANDGTVLVQSGDLMLAPGECLNAGHVRIDAGRTLTRVGGPYVNDVGGVTTVNGTFSTDGNQFLNLGGELRGTGTVTVVNNSVGLVAPGNPAADSAIGTMLCSGSFGQGFNGALEIEVAGSGQNDRLQSFGPIALDGTLIVNRVNGFVPNPNEEFTIVQTFGTLVGQFHTIESCDTVTVIYGRNSVKIKIAAAGIGADFNGDGHVNAADLAILLGAWGSCGSECCAADLNADGLVNAADLAILLGSWG